MLKHICSTAACTVPGDVWPKAMCCTWTYFFNSSLCCARRCLAHSLCNTYRLVHVRICLQKLLHIPWTCLQLHVYKSLCCRSICLCAWVYLSTRAYAVQYTYRGLLTRALCCNWTFLSPWVCAVPVRVRLQELVCFTWTCLQLHVYKSLCCTCTCDSVPHPDVSVDKMCCN